MSSAAGSRAIAWCNGQWGAPNELMLPLADRGLQLADGLFETVLILAGQPQLLNEHLQRWQQGAALLGLAPPPAAAVLLPLIAEAVAQAGLSAGAGALRLNWSRGDSEGRGIDLPSDGAANASNHRFWLQLSPSQPSFAPLRAIVSQQERRNASSLLSRCKSFAYGQSIQARREARAAGADEALLLSTSGELCCGSTANLLVQRRGRWLTPALSSGCLPGVMRGRLLALNLAEERRLEAQPEAGDQWLLINSISCRPIQQLAGQTLTVYPAAEALWRSLLSCSPAPKSGR